MWLFDNLFLDKNTPMAINTGEKQEWSDKPSPPVGSSGSAGWGQPPPPPPPVEVPVVQAVISELPPLTQGGVAESITDASVSSPSSSSDVSFDIGGDLGYIAEVSADANIPAGPVVSIENPIATVPDSPIVVSDNSSPQVLSVPDMWFSVSGVPTTESPVIVVESVTDITADVSPSWVIMQSDTPLIDSLQWQNPVSTPLTESPLTTLMNSYENQSQQNIPANPTPPAPVESPVIDALISPLISPDMPTPTPVTDTSVVSPVSTLPDSGWTDALFGLMADTVPIAAEAPKPEEPKKEISVWEVSLFSIDPVSPPVTIDPAVVSETSVPETPVTIDVAPIIDLSASISPAVTSEPESSVIEDELPMSTVGKELARMTRSPRLQGKLVGFIAGLEELSKEEEIVKNEKRKQIESYQTRIQELKAEYEVRIHALELEEADLKKQIATMDEEREHLTQVIDGFKKELEVV